MVSGENHRIVKKVPQISVSWLIYMKMWDETWINCDWIKSREGDLWVN